jgi:hypothetical protein
VVFVQPEPASQVVHAEVLPVATEPVVQAAHAE